MADALSSFKLRINTLAKAISDFKVQGISAPGANEITDFRAGKSRYLQSNVKRAVLDLKKNAWSLVEVRSADPSNEVLLLDILNSINTLSQDDAPDVLEKKLSSINLLASRLVQPAFSSPSSQFSFDVPELPEEITSDIMADMNEIRKSFDASCYRSCVILCGRILEAALNRRYFEVSGNDLLETSPGLGLGKIIAKLAEKGVKFDPGLTQQIHMVNQVRIYSVHKKKDAFYPSKGQTQAMILYTMDVLRKLFSE